MSSQAPQLAIDRPRLEARLRTDLLEQGHHHESHTGNLEQLQELEARIQATARQLRPDAPETAILEARRKLAYDDLAKQLVSRAQLPGDPVLAPDPLRIRLLHLDRNILDLARDLEPADPGTAIAQATPIAKRHLESQKELVHPDPAEHLDLAQEKLPEISRQMKRRATYPEPTPQQRVHRVLGDLRRLELLDRQHRDASEARRRLAFGGNVSELNARLRQLPEACDLLEESAAEIYRDPDLALGKMRQNTSTRGSQDTIERFEKNPTAFGELRGAHVPGLGDSPTRSKVLDLVSHSSGHASTALARLDRMESELDLAGHYQGLQRDSRELVQAYPSREKLMTELGRHMEGLGIHEVQPLLWPEQQKLVQDLRKAELTFLKPLREAGLRFQALDAGGARLGAQAQKIASLFQGAPQHILRRLNPPQMQAVLVATAIAKRAKELVTRVARV